MDEIKESEIILINFLWSLGVQWDKSYIGILNWWSSC